MKETHHNDLNQRYSKGTIVIHWLSALLIVILFPLGKYMAGLDPSEKMGLIRIHVILGVIVSILTIIRSWIFFKAPRPAHIKTGSKLNDNLVIWIHGAFYFLLFGIAISGIATLILGGYGEALSNGNSELIKNSGAIPPLKGHEIMTMILMLLFVMHVIGVVKHYVVKRENTLNRIT